MAVKHIIRQLASRNHHLARIYLKWGFLLSEFSNDEPIIVYQMGKVGSSTIVASLQALKLGRPVYHVHTLLPARMEDRRQKYAKMLRNVGGMDLRRANHILVSQHLHKKLARRRPGDNWKVVSLVRDPVGMNVSGFFQIIDYYVPNFCERLECGALSIGDAIETFFKEYDHEKPLTWFDLELKSTFGVDVFATPFPMAKGYAVYRGESVEVLVLRLEDIDARAGDAFREFLSIESFDLIKANISEGKKYSAAYQDFKTALRLPREYLERMYESQFARHFYTDAEIKSFREKWQT